jgi:hypothetical protein
MRLLSDDYKYEKRRLSAMRQRYEQDGVTRSNLRHEYVAG